ncbi:hypothetical protein CFH99_01180 [Nocardioides aromaticivorans]|uniref:DUF11 domain-containing protein n=1 Tax=Nocardioides aromaticivorans TaxID=200618 RepID=A0ABX7PED2_9ACTN|nr:LPXTG cell wall anchor domain-containing protein [Nocardioides aromaticivorans]QSR24236.1 hypothetical protein CFH99_01180 [Nocardioides aromaticivorans]
MWQASQRFPDQRVRKRPTQLSPPRVRHRPAPVSEYGELFQMSKHAARRRRSHASRRLRRPALVSGAVALALLLVAAALPGAPRSAAPVTDALLLAAAGVPEAGTPIFTETFSEQNASTTGINILNYSGTNGMTYDADPAYTPAGAQCNGWVMNSLTPQPTAAQDAGCANNQPDGWNQLRQMAISLGLAQGQTAAQAADNQVLTEYTNATNGSIPAGYELKSEGSIPAIAGHYYAVSAYFAEVNCFAAHAKMTFSLVINGTPTVLSTGLDPCTAPGGTVPIPNGARVVKLQSAAMQLPATGAQSLGLQLYNATTSGSGNDVSFDLPQIVDVTPSLDKSFSPPLIAPGGVSTLTFTVTNTTELMAKNDWSFTDNLPAGLKVAATPNVGGTCTSTTGAPLVRTATAGATSIAVTGGDLALNQESCTVTVDVTSDIEGTYVNGPANVTTNLLPPEDTPLEVLAPRIRLVKALDAPRITDADQFTVQIHRGSATGAVVNSTAASTTTGTGTTVTTGTGTTGTYVADVDTTYFLTETASSGTDLGAYDKTITCVDANGRQTGLPSGATFSGSLSIKPVAGADVTCTLTNTADPQPAIELLKRVASVDDVNGNGLTDLGDEINYVFDLENTGNVTLTDVAVDDPLLAGLGITVTCDPTTLAPGASVTCTADEPYVITQADVDAGTVENVATATGTPPSGPVVETPESPTVTPLDGEPAIELVKTADKTDLVVGETMTYTFVATNTGTVTLSDVVVEESAFSGSGTVSAIDCDPTAPAVLAPGESMECTATYVVTQADVDAGQVDNAATTTGTPPSGPKVTDEDDVTVPGTSEPAIELVKTADKTDLVVGETMTYTFVTTNTGNVTLSDVVIAESAFTGSGTVSAIDCDPTAPSVLAPGESMECTATYVVTQADVDAGQVDNAATTTGTPPSGPKVTDEDDVTVPGTSEPAIELVKTADKTDLVVGETMTYTFVTTNTGNVTLSDVVIAESAFTGSGTVSAIDCDPTAPAVLAPGESMECTATYVVTQADVDAGQVDNAATTTGTPPSGPKVTDEDDVTVPGTSEPAIELVKTADKTDLVVGETMTYTFVTTNTGNVTLSDVVIAESAFTGSGTVSAIDCDPTAPAVLAPGESMECTATYVVTQADVDAGQVDNAATTTGTPPSGPKVTDEDDVTVPGTSEPAIELVKTADKTDLVVGETMTYTFVTTNTGTVTLSDVVVEESAFSGSGTVSAIDCDPTAPSVLAPGESMECTATYVVTQADVDAGQVDNAATTTGTPPSGPKVTDEDDVTVPGTQAPELELLKRVASVDDVNGNGLTDLGDEINYVFDLENTGNVTLTDVAVDDPLLAGLGITVTCDPTTLAPGASVTCTADEPYVITQADVDAGTVENVATATGTPPSGPVVETPESPTVTPLDGEPAIELVKTADKTDLVVGETMTYTFVTTNTGNVTLSDVVIAESAFTGSGTVSAIDCDPTAPAVLAPGESMECTATYVVTQADVDAGQVDNAATTTGTPPSGPKVTDEDDVTVPGTSEPELSLNKRVSSVSDVNDNGLTDLGDEIEFVFDLENTGNVTLTDVAVDDPLLAGLGITVTCDPTTLAPGASVTCTADEPYVITQADMDAGTVENTATSHGTPPTGPPVPSNPDETVTELDDEPALVLDKRVTSVTDVDGDGRTDEGDEIAYAFDLTNTGNVTLTELVVDDPMLEAAGIAVTCPVTSLAPSETVTCLADEAYVITAADVDAGAVRNTATAGYTPPGQPPVVTPPDSVTTPIELPEPDVSSGSAGSGGGLPNTGGPSLLLIGGAGISLLAGLVLVGRNRRKVA